MGSIRLMITEDPFSIKECLELSMRLDSDFEYTLVLFTHSFHNGRFFLAYITLKNEIQW